MIIGDFKGNFKDQTLISEHILPSVVTKSSATSGEHLQGHHGPLV